MKKAIWKDMVLAESDKSIEIESNDYFPPESVKREFLKESQTHTTCPWKGEASYYNVEINGQVNKDAAWYYPNPKPEATQIKNHIAFWKGVVIQ